MTRQNNTGDRRCVLPHRRGAVSVKFLFRFPVGAFAFIAQTRSLPKHGEETIFVSTEVLCVRQQSWGQTAP